MRTQKSDLWELYNELMAILEEGFSPIDSGLALLVDLLEEGRALGGQLERFVVNVAALARQQSIEIDVVALARARREAGNLKELGRVMGLRWPVDVCLALADPFPLVVAVIRVWLRLQDDYELIAKLALEYRHLEGFQQIDIPRSAPRAGGGSADACAVN